MTDHAHAMSIAWEQVAFWQTYMTTRDAGEALGYRYGRHPSWEEIANTLARIWLHLEREPTCSEVEDSAAFSVPAFPHPVEAISRETALHLGV